MVDTQAISLQKHTYRYYPFACFSGPPQANRHTENDVVENSVEDAEQQKVLKAESVPSMYC